jgi:hypothetical protein
MPRKIQQSRIDRGSRYIKCLGHVGLVKSLSCFHVEDVHDATFWVEKYGLALVRVVASINASNQFNFSTIKLGSTV